VDHPDIDVDLDGIECAKGVAAISQSDLENSAIDALERFRLRRLAPSAATVSASSMSLCTSCGKLSKSLRAALIQEMFLVFRI
jgi:hypothetical protein